MVHVPRASSPDWMLAHQHAIVWLSNLASVVSPAQQSAVFDDSLVVFAASALVGGVAIHAAAQYVTDTGQYGDAVLTALLGALAWGVLDGVPLVGGVLALVAWVAVIKWRYPVGWTRATLIGGGAWAVATVVIAALALIGVGSLEALGVPGA